MIDEIKAGNGYLFYGHNGLCAYWRTRSGTASSSGVYGAEAAARLAEAIERGVPAIDARPDKVTFDDMCRLVICGPMTALPNEPASRLFSQSGDPYGPLDTAPFWERAKVFEAAGAKLHNIPCD